MPLQKLLKRRNKDRGRGRELSTSESICIFLIKLNALCNTGNVKISYTIIFLFIFLGQTQGQQVFQLYTQQNGTLKYGNSPANIIPYSNRGFTIVLPEKSQSVRGTILMLEDNPVDLHDTTKTVYSQIEKEACPKGFAVLHISTGIPLDLYFSLSSLQYVDSVLASAFRQYHIPNQNIFLLGVMVSGHRALKYIEYCKKGKSLFNPHITGVILCESAIDWVRQWYECQKQVRDSLSAVGYFEGNFISYLFKINLKTTPVTGINAYINFSPYSYFDIKMSKPKLYKELSIRAYTYADTRYWFSAQGHGVYDSNYPDMSGFINEEKLAGNKNAELIVFHSNPDDPLKTELRSQSQTWDLVDKAELVEWMIKKSK
jgi:hypothetical protein